MKPWVTGAAAVVFVVLAAFVLGQIFGWWAPFDTSKPVPEATRLPNEYLYLDDERVDAYLGQLQRGLSASEMRSSQLTLERHAQLGGDVAQVGGKSEEQESVQSTVSSRAADRYYDLEGRLRTFGGGDRMVRVDVPRVTTDATLKRFTARVDGLREGEFVRIRGARLKVPTFAIALSKLAYADQLLPPGQGPVRAGALSRFAAHHSRALRTYVQAFGHDPELPLQVLIDGPLGDYRPAGQAQPFPANDGGRRPGASVTMLLPIRYSNLTDQPALLTGHVTIVGKVVRQLGHGGDTTYFDVAAAARYERAVRRAPPGVKQTLGLEQASRSKVDAAVRAEGPGLVVLPLAIYQ